MKVAQFKRKGKKSYSFTVDRLFLSACVIMGYYRSIHITGQFRLPANCLSYLTIYHCRVSRVVSRYNFYPGLLG